MVILKKEFNQIKKRTLAQVYEMAKPYVESDLMTLWYEIEELKQKKEK